MLRGKACTFLECQVDELNIACFEMLSTEVQPVARVCQNYRP